MTAAVSCDTATMPVPGFSSPLSTACRSGSDMCSTRSVYRRVRLLDTTPTLVCVNLERPAVLPEIAANAAALVADYGASDASLLDVAFGRARAQGRLPFELPRSMAAVEASRPDVPNDTVDPVFPCGYGIELSTTRR